MVDRLLSDITYQSADNLVDALTKAEEEGYTYEHYYGNKKHQSYGPDYQYVYFDIEKVCFEVRGGRGAIIII